MAYTDGWANGYDAGREAEAAAKDACFACGQSPDLLVTLRLADGIRYVYCLECLGANVALQEQLHQIARVKQASLLIP